MDQQAPAVRSSYKLDAGVFIFTLVLGVLSQWYFYWGFHYPIEHPRLAMVWAGIIYFGSCAAVGFLILRRLFRRRIHKSLFLVAAAIVLFMIHWMGPSAYPYFGESFDWLRFQKDRQFYRETVASTDPSTVHVFKWGEGHNFGKKYFRYLIFDNNRVGQRGEGLRATLSAAVTHPEPIGGAIDTSKLTDSTCSRSGRRLTEGFLIVRATCSN